MTTQKSAKSHFLGGSDLVKFYVGWLLIVLNNITLETIDVPSQS